MYVYACTCHKWEDNFWSWFSSLIAPWAQVWWQVSLYTKPSLLVSKLKIYILPVPHISDKKQSTTTYILKLLPNSLHFTLFLVTFGSSWTCLLAGCHCVCMVEAALYTMWWAICSRVSLPQCVLSLIYLIHLHVLAALNCFLVEKLSKLYKIINLFQYFLPSLLLRQV